jgi:hypothetical protein
MTKIVPTLLIVASISAGARAQSATFESPLRTATYPLAHAIEAREPVRLSPGWLHADARHDPPGAPSQTQSGHRVRHPVLLGAAIGAGAGFVLNASACRTGESVCTAAGNLMMAGIGAGVGAVVGAIVGR